ncbi:MAG TPA: DUF4189 domain-containing protein [Sphingopyxis sp.]|nr:DUF4189 domain-containing protein [Sphingopyxis sp.]
MKYLPQGAFLVAAAALFIATPRDEAHGQTQCPQGATPGSMACGPDNNGYAGPSGPQLYRKRLDGFGGFAYNIDTGQVYKSSQPGTSIRRSEERAMISCRQPLHDPEWSMTVSPHPDAQCAPILAWQNGCAAVTEGQVNGQRQFFAVKTNSKSSARTRSLQACEQSGATQCTPAHEAHCTKPVNRIYER